MKRILITFCLLFALSVPLSAAGTFGVDNLGSWQGLTVLNNLWKVGGDIYCDFTSGGWRGNFGLGTSKEVLTYQLFLTKQQQLRNTPLSLSLEYGFPIAFPTFTARGFSVIYDLTPHITSMAIFSQFSGFKFGCWLGNRLDLSPNDAGYIVGGVRAQALRINLNLLGQ